MSEPTTFTKDDIMEIIHDALVEFIKNDQLLEIQQVRVNYILEKIVLHNAHCSFTITKNSIQ